MRSRIFRDEGANKQVNRQRFLLTLAGKIYRWSDKPFGLIHPLVETFNQSRDRSGRPQSLHKRSFLWLQAVLLNLLIIGDVGCGKTSLISTFSLGYLPAHPVPNVFNKHAIDCWVDGQSVKLALHDTAGQEYCGMIGPLTYAQTDVMVIAFSIESPESFFNARQKWIREAQEHCPGTPITIVGLKKDLRQEKFMEHQMCKRRVRFIDAEEAAEIAKQCGAVQYYECSSLAGEAVDEVLKRLPELRC
ncbi:rho family, other [Exophiala aquamarina CBS 119918]|uniref:Rho family, other n=1 Tax=Exophiala aquamarina CBS 119918 TaxID=1182545 RepID=A0A072P9K9_9EURO|nr:rho family, other [Exophiala aquamarina CBS 119918]KEF52245.1 rho family, other [Exophiala aquamarina CBS 119918]